MHLHYLCCLPVFFKASTDYVSNVFPETLVITCEVIGMLHFHAIRHVGKPTVNALLSQYSLRRLWSFTKNRPLTAEVFALQKPPTQAVTGSN